MRTRITSAIFVAVVVLALSAALFNGAPGAIATQGQPVIAGQENSETSGTTFCRLTAGTCGFVNTALYAQTDSSNGSGLTGLNATPGGVGVHGLGSYNGVHAEGGTFGVFAEGDDYGVYAQGPNYGVFGQADSSTGVGVAAAAEAPSGTALSVQGKAQFSRSGKATVAGTAASPKSSVVVTGVALTAKSLILVTEQKNVAGTWVRAAVPNVANSRFTLYLNKNVSVGFPVAWMVIEKP